MNIKHINVGIIHSLIGKNDGVSIVIDQTVNAMVGDMGIGLGNIYYLAAHSSPRFNAETHETFWHKNEIHRTIIKYFNTEPPENLDELIHYHALKAKDIIAKWVEKHNIDLIIAHNTSHPYNFITAVGLGYYIEGLRKEGTIWPKVLVWWHDSFFERERFKNPNPVIEKYLKYLPGTYVDGIAFINKIQPILADKYFEKYNPGIKEKFFRERTVVVPNTTEIPWDWKNQDWDGEKPIHPPKDSYNDSLFVDIGLECEVNKRGFDVEDVVYLLQHTRVVPRKKIELAIDFAFKLEKKYISDNIRKCIVLLISGHSGDEQEEYKKYLKEYYKLKLQEEPGANVVMIFGERHILSHRDIIVDHKYYQFSEIPGVIACYNGLGTYFSEVEGFGNNLLEMVTNGLPVLINKYEIYKTDIEELGFDLPAIEDLMLTEELVDSAYQILTNTKERNKMVKHNLEILHEKLDHKIIADKISPLIQKMFTKILI